MKTKLPIIKWLALFALAIFNLQFSTAFAQGTTAFTYQGQLHDNGTNANGNYTMIFSLYDAVTSGNQIGSTITTSATLANGLFSVNLDFGSGGFNGSARWLDITVTNGPDTQELSPRVQLLPSPYALYAAVAATVTNNAIMNAQLAGNAVNTTNIQNNAITTMQIVNGAVTDAKIVSVSGGKVTGTVGSATNALLLDGLGSANFAMLDDLTNYAQLDDLTNYAQLDDLTNYAELDDKPIFTDGISFQQGTSGTTTWDVSVGNFAHGNQNVPNVLQFSTPSGTLLAISSTGQGISMDGTLTITTGNSNCTSIQADGGISAGGNILAESFNTTSDRNLKEKFTPIDNQEILQRVAILPISTWNFKTDAKTRHIGPMAQDFYAAFNVGPDDKHIATVDEDGVALAAIQGLNEKLNVKDAQIEALSKRLADLEQLVKSSTQK
jgi:hypothetical protein